MVVVRGRPVPPVVLAYGVIDCALAIYGIANSPTLLHHPVVATADGVLLAFWLTAIVVWRQRWAWSLSVLAARVPSF